MFSRHVQTSKQDCNTSVQALARPKKGRGYDIRIQRTGYSFLSEQHHLWGIEGELPSEWEQVKQEPNVEQAVIFYSTQRKVRADKRQYLDTYSRTS